MIKEAIPVFWGALFSKVTVAEDYNEIEHAVQRLLLPNGGGRDRKSVV